MDDGELRFSECECVHIFFRFIKLIRVHKCRRKNSIKKRDIRSYIPSFGFKS